MRKSRAPGFLARRTDVRRQINGDDRIGAVNVKNHFQTVRQSEFFVINLETSVFQPFSERKRKSKKTTDR